jgi:hypothetical protein
MKAPACCSKHTCRSGLCSGDMVTFASPKCMQSCCVRAEGKQIRSCFFPLSLDSLPMQNVCGHENFECCRTRVHANRGSGMFGRWKYQLDGGVLQFLCWVKTSFVWDSSPENCFHLPNHTKLNWQFVHAHLRLFRLARAYSCVTTFTSTYSSVCGVVARQLAPLHWCS